MAARHGLPAGTTGRNKSGRGSTAWFFAKPLETRPPVLLAYAGTRSYHQPIGWRPTVGPEKESKQQKLLRTGVYWSTRCAAKVDSLCWMDSPR